MFMIVSHAQLIKTIKSMDKLETSLNLSLSLSNFDYVSWNKIEDKLDLTLLQDIDFTLKISAKRKIAN